MAINDFGMEKEYSEKDPVIPGLSGGNNFRQRAENLFGEMQNYQAQGTRVPNIFASQTPNPDKFVSGVILDRMENLQPTGTRVPNFNPPTPSPQQPGMFNPELATPQDFSRMRSRIPDMGQIGRGEFGRTTPFKDPVTGAILFKPEGSAGATMPNGQRIGSPMASAPIQGDTQTYNAPGGGTFAVPKGALDYTPEQLNDAQSLGFGSVDEMNRAHRQAGRVNDSKARMGSRSIIKSLRDQGMKDQEIKDQAMLTPQMSATEAYRRLTELNNRRADNSAQARNQARIDQRISGKERWDVDEQGNRTPKNQAARLSVMANEMQSTGPDPANEKTVYDELTPGQKREYERYRKMVANGVAMSEKEKRIGNMISGIQNKREQEYANKQAKEKDELHDLALENAKTKQQREQVQLIKTQREELFATLYTEDNAGRLVRNDALDDETWNAMKARYDELGTSVMSIGNQDEITPPIEQPSATAPTELPTPTTQEEFDALPAGAEYIDPDDGKRYRK